MIRLYSVGALNFTLEALTDPRLSGEGADFE